MYTKTFYTVENADSSDTATIFGTCFFLSKKNSKKISNEAKWSQMFFATVLQ